MVCCFCESNSTAKVRRKERRDTGYGFLMPMGASSHLSSAFVPNLDSTCGRPSLSTQRLAEKPMIPIADNRCCSSTTAVPSVRCCRFIRRFGLEASATASFSCSFLLLYFTWMPLSIALFSTSIHKGAPNVGVREGSFKTTSDVS